MMRSFGFCLGVFVHRIDPPVDNHEPQGCILPSTVLPRGRYATLFCGDSSVLSGERSMCGRSSEAPDCAFAAGPPDSEKQARSTMLDY